MTQFTPTDDQLLAWFDEQLPPAEMTAVEKALRRSEPLRRRAAAVARRRDSGQHSIGAIWRRMRLSCPSRSELGGYLLGTLDSATSEYIDFHIHVVGCRYCAANRRDLEDARRPPPESESRRRKFFQSSAGYLKRSGD